MIFSRLKTGTFILGAALAGATVAVGNPQKYQDVSLISGFALGTVRKLQGDGSEQIFKIGGMPLGVGWNFDLHRDWSTNVGGQILLDVVNRQMIRQGLTGAISYHLLGGSRRIDHEGEVIAWKEINAYNLSIVARMGLFNYAASDPKSPNTNLSGGLWEVALGVEYRKEVSATSALGVSILSSVTTLPASVTRLAASGNEVLIFWRRFW